MDRTERLCTTLALPHRAWRARSPGSVGTAVAQDDGYVIGVSNTVAGNGWREEMICSIKAQAAASGEVASLNLAHRNTDSAGQLEDIRNLIAAGVDAIIINASDPSALDAAIKEATDAGIVGRRGRLGRHRAVGIRPGEQPGRIRAPRRRVALRDAGRRRQRVLHARPRRSLRGHRPRHRASRRHSRTIPTSRSPTRSSPAGSRMKASSRCST